MRIWIGKEKEGKQKGIETLFVESSAVGDEDLYLVHQLAINHNVDRIYFGAGRIDVLKMSVNWKECLKGFSVIVETKERHIKCLPHRDAFNSIIVRIDIRDKSHENIIPKVDNNKKVSLYYKSVDNSLRTLSQGIYEDTDVIIYSKN